MATITSEAWTNQCPKNVNTYLHTYLVSFKTLIGSLFPLRVKCQNHERAPISPILVVHVFSSCQDMGHQNRGNRDPLMVLALHPGKTLRGSLFPLLPLRVKCQNHERAPISPILVLHVFSSCQDMDHGFGTSPLGAIGEIGTLWWFPAASWPPMVTTVGTFAYKPVGVLISMFWWHISSTSLSYHNFLCLLTWSCWSSSYYLTSYSEITPCELKLSSSCL